MLSQQEIINELKKTNQVIFELEQFIEGREGMIIDQLPDNLQKSLLQLKLLPPISSTGLEKIETILEDLYNAQFILKLKSEGKPIPGYEEESLVEGPFAKSTIKDLDFTQGKPANTVKIPVKEEMEAPAPRPRAKNH